MTQLFLFEDTQADLFPGFIPDPQPIICVDPANKQKAVELKKPEFELLKLIALYCTRELGHCTAMNNHFKQKDHSPYQWKSTRTIQRALKLLSDLDFIEISYLDKARNKRIIDVTEIGYDRLKLGAPKQVKIEKPCRGNGRAKVARVAAVSQISSLSSSLSSLSTDGEQKKVEQISDPEILTEIQPQVTYLKGASSWDVYDTYLFCLKTVGDTEKEWIDSLPARGITLLEFESIKREWEGRKAV